MPRTSVEWHRSKVVGQWKQIIRQWCGDLRFLRQLFRVDRFQLNNIIGGRNVDQVGGHGSRLQWHQVWVSRKQVHGRWFAVVCTRPKSASKWRLRVHVCWPSQPLACPSTLGSAPPPLIQSTGRHVHKQRYQLVGLSNHRGRWSGARHWRNVDDNDIVVPYHLAPAIILCLSSITVWLIIGRLVGEGDHE